MFKQISLVKTEDIGSAGSWFRIAQLEKQQAGFTSAYIDKVRISFILDDIAGTGVNVIPFGYLFTASTSDAGPSTSEYLISASASGNSGGGVVTLPIDRRVVDNTPDAESGEAAISLYVEATDATLTADVELRMVIEVWGRWHTVINA